MIVPVRVVLAVLLAAAALSWGPRADASDASASARAESERAIFTGRFVSRPEVQFGGSTSRVRLYRVEVTEVFGPLDIETERVRVRSRFVLEDCGTTEEQPGAGDQPGDQPTGGATTQAPSGPARPTPTLNPGPSETPSPTQDPTETPGAPIDRQLRIFDAVVQGSEYVIASCDDVGLATETVVEETETQFGPGRPPGIDTVPTPDPFDDVSYLCPDTRDALPDLTDQDACDALQDDQSFDRAAAPGLALVIVGVLGLVVARRMGRTRR